MRTLVARLLAQEGFSTLQADDAQTAFELLRDRGPDLVLLDIMLASDDGIDVLQRIRAESDVPVIMLTALGNEADRIVGLRNGADDYIVKPFSPGELSARIESVLRRTRAVPAGKALKFDELSIDITTREVSVADKLIDLTAKEFDLLAFLARSPRQVFSRGQLLAQVWESSTEWQDPATVTEHVRRVRRKIESDPDNPRWLQTVRGVGYRFDP